VAATDGAHLQYLTFDEFDVIVFRKDPDFGHPVVLVYVEASFLDPDSHVFSPRFGRNHRPGYWLKARRLPCRQVDRYG
jgi:hypothetical protein